MYVIIYAVLGVLNLAAELGHFSMVSMLTKILLMPTLMVYVWQTAGSKDNTRWVLIALFFSWLGDIFLMFPRDNYSEGAREALFIAGLVSFLIAHIQYIIAFIKDIHPYPKVSLLIEKPYLVIPFIVFLFALLRFLIPHTGVLTFPICIYGITIVSMSMTALNRKNIVTDRSFLLVFSGALLFVLSDSTIAITLFYQHFELERIVIMSTYIIAQLCITYGFVLNKTEKNRI